MDRTSCSLCGEPGCQSTTVSAGEVTADLAACGYRAAMLRLPAVNIARQDYTAGLCPACAMEKGTLFPELISNY